MTIAQIAMLAGGVGVGAQLVSRLTGANKA